MKRKMDLEMDEQKIYEIIGKPVFSWVLSKLLNKSFDWLKGEKEREKNEFEEIVNVITHQYQNEKLERKHFIELLNDEKVKENLKAFEQGEVEISISILVEAIIKIAFNGISEKKEIAEAIVDNLLQEIRSYIFSDSYYAHRFAYSLNRILSKSMHEYGQKIIKELGIISDKVDFIGHNSTKTYEEICHIKQLLLSKPELIQQTTDTEINKIISIANGFVEEGKLISAREIYVKILEKIDKKESRILWRLNSNIGKTYINSYDEKEGIKYFEEAYKYFPNEKKGKIQLVYARLLAHDSPSGLQIVDEILDLEPDCEEALIAKCNLLMISGNLREAIEIISKTNLDTFESLYTSAFIHNRISDNQNAKSIIQKALERKRLPIALELLAVIIIEQLLKIYNQNKPLKLDKSSSLFLDANEALNYLDEAIVNLRDKEDKKLLAEVYHNRGVIYSLLRDKEKCLDDFKKSLELGIKDGLVYLNLGTAYLQNNDFDRAEEHFKKALELGEPHALNYLSLTFLLNNKLVEAKELLLKKAKGEITSISEENVMSYLVLSEIYERELNESDAKQIIAELKKQFPQNILVIEREVSFMCNHGDIESAIELLKENLNRALKENDHLLFILADLYFQIKSWDKSTEILAKMINNNEYGSIEKKYLYGMVNLGRYTEALDYISSYELSISSNIEDMQKIKGDIFLSHERFTEATAIFKKLASSFRKAEYYIKWGLSEFRIGELENTEVILNSATKDFIDSPKDLLRISSAYSFLGNTMKALEIAFQVLQQLSEDIDTVKNYLSVFMSHTQQNPNDEIENKYKIAFRNNIDSFKEKFPNDDSWRITDVGENFEELKNMLREQENHLQQVDQIHDIHKLPISMLSKLIRRNIYETWYNYTYRTDTKVWAYNAKYYRIEYKNIRNYFSEIVIEPIAFFTLYHTNQITLLSRFTKCYYPQRLLDILMLELNMMRMQRKNGLMTVYSLNGQLYKNEISVWEIENNIKKLMEMIQVVKGNTIGYVADKNENHNNDETFELLDDSIKQAIQYSLSKKIPILIDESSIYELFYTKYNLIGFSTLTLFRLSRASNTISTKEYNSILLNLVRCNYHFISLSDNIIAQALRENKFKMSYETQFIFKYMNQPYINEQSVAMVIADFFIILYNEAILDITRNIWFDYALDCLPRNHINMTLLLKMLYNRISQKSNGLVECPYILTWLDKNLRTWSVTRAVPYFK